MTVNHRPGARTPLAVEFSSRWRHSFPYLRSYVPSLDDGNRQAVCPQPGTPREIDVSTLSKKSGVRLLTGIANPRPMQQYLARHRTAQEELRYPDHYNFSDSDLTQIAHRLASLHGEAKYINTLDKDAARPR